MRARLVLGCLLASGSAGLGGCVPGGAIAQPGASSCPAAQCAGGVSFAADLSATSADAPNLELRLCRNDLCSTIQPAAAGASFDCGFAGPLTAACRITASGSGLHLEVTFQGAMTGWADGDVFAVRVGLPGATPLIDVQRAVTYTVSHPAGPDCPPVCRSATLS